MKEQIYRCWQELYPGTGARLLDNFLASLDASPIEPAVEKDPRWYKEAIVYCLYVDLFHQDFAGLVARLDYLQDLGVNCLWLLPVLSSPGRDGGFDVDDHYAIRQELGGRGQDAGQQFSALLGEARKRNMRVIFDLPINHTSDQHFWFREAVKSPANPYREYYIWTKDPQQYASARIIFKGIEDSNWEVLGDQWYFHRFFHFQPDLNYRNPEVLLAMSAVLLHWQHAGVDGFRADAIPYLWKEEGTTCENLPGTHAIIRFFRALLDYRQAGTLLLAEACQPPVQVVEYLGVGDECHAAYHFPLMPRIFMALALQDGLPVRQTLAPEFTPPIPADTQWFTFLRCHDELSLEKVYVTEEERAYLHRQYCLQADWDFRQGEGISARLAELLGRDPERILLAFSLMLSLPGTPVIYYGDEFGKCNDTAFYTEMTGKTGKNDSRFLVRGRINWPEVESSLSDPGTLASRVFYPLRAMLLTRRQHPALATGTLAFVQPISTKARHLLAYTRSIPGETLVIVHNLHGESIDFQLPGISSPSPLLPGTPHSSRLGPWGYGWYRVDPT